MTEDTYMRSSILLVGIIIALLTGCTQDVENDVSDELITEQSQTEEQQVMEIEHQKASWACNTYIDTDLPELDYADEDKIIFRPSGTEPKVKFYFLVIAPDSKTADARIEAY